MKAVENDVPPCVEGSWYRERKMQGEKGVSERKEEENEEEKEERERKYFVRVVCIYTRTAVIAN